VTAHGTGPGRRRGAQRRTSGLIFRDALEQPGGKQGWVGTARARNGRGGNQAQVVRRVLTRQRQKTTRWDFCARAKKSKVCKRPGSKDKKRGGTWAGQPPAEPDHRSGKNVSSSPPSARKNIIVLSLPLPTAALLASRNASRPAPGGASALLTERQRRIEDPAATYLPGIATADSS
jgi:hypothetical protein